MINIFEKVVSQNDLGDLRQLLETSKFIDGKETAGFRAVRVKNNEQASRKDDRAIEVQDRILDAVWDHRKFARYCHIKHITPPLISRSGKGMGYGLHVDDAQIGEVGNKIRSDISTTIFLREPDEYEGGELEIITPFGVTAFKLPAGQAITYPSRFIHQVREVTSGERLVAVSWIQSHVRHEQHREILLELDQVNQKLHELAPNAPETDIAFKVYANLTRQWCE